MKITIFVAAILMFLCAHAIRAAGQKISDREELVRLEREWNAAYNRDDKGTVGSVLADDYVLVDADANLLNKQQNMPEFYLACLYGALGRKDEAFEWLNRAFKERINGLAGIKTWPFAGRLIMEDFIFIDADGYVLTKRQYLDTISRVQVKSDNLKIVEVRLHGDTGIVTTVWSGTYSFDGNDTTETIRYMDVFIKRNGNWQTVASQGTRIPVRS